MATFSKYINGQSFAEENVCHKCVKSDFNYNHTFLDHTIHNTFGQNLDDEQLEGSGFVVNRIINVILEIYKINDIQAPLNIKLPEKYKINKSIIKIKIMMNFVFFWCILAYLYPVENHKNRT